MSAQVLRLRDHRPAADLTPDEARALTDRIRASVAELLPLIKEAFDRRADLALGYASWPDYCDAELRGLRLPVTERRELVGELRKDGHSVRTIASAVGADKNTVLGDIRRLSETQTDGLPETVRSLDGRERPATRPAAEVTGEFPIVLVAQEYGEPVEAELREERPGNPDVVKVVYLRSRTAAWIKRSRIVTTDIPARPGPAIPPAASEPPSRPGTQVTPVGADGGGEVKRDAGLDAAPRSDPEPERPKPPAWDPEERRQHEAEVQRIRDIAAAHRAADNILTEVRSLVVTIVAGCRYGETGLVTPDMIADLRKAIDLLEGEL